MKQFARFLALLSCLTAVLLSSSLLAQTDQTSGGRKVVNKVVPTYPAVARAMNLTGTVKLEVMVEPEGKVKSIQVKGGNPLLAQAAQTAVREWRWEKSAAESTELVEFRFNP